MLIEFIISNVWLAKNLTASIPNVAFIKLLQDKLLLLLAREIAFISFRRFLPLLAA